MRGLADEMMRKIKSIFGNRGINPPENRLDDEAGVFGRESVRGENGDDHGPKNGGPPRAKPGGNARLRGWSEVVWGVSSAHSFRKRQMRI